MLIEQSEKKLNVQIEYAFIMFRSMTGMKLVQEAYSISTPVRAFIRSFFWCMRKENAMLDKKMINFKWPEQREAKMPESINWNNMGVSELYRFALQSVFWFISLLLVFVTIIVNFAIIS